MNGVIGFFGLVQANETFCISCVIHSFDEGFIASLTLDVTKACIYKDL